MVVSLTRTRSIDTVELVTKLELLDGVRGLPSVSAGL